MEQIEKQFEKRFFAHQTVCHMIRVFGHKRFEEKYCKYLLDISPNLKQHGGHYTVEHEENGVCHVYSHWPRGEN